MILQEAKYISLSKSRTLSKDCIVQPQLYYVIGLLGLFRTLEQHRFIDDS
jgi:hypothetical protein